MKSLEALEKLYEEREYLLGEKVNHKTKNWHNDITHYDNINKCLLTIKQDLDRLEAIDNANPSKALECLEEMAKYRIEYSEYLMPIKDISEYKTIKQTLVKAQEQEKILKALEIIKKKRVACDLLTNSDVTDYKKYNSHCDKYDFIVPLTEEEFKLLKGILNDEQ